MNNPGQITMGTCKKNTGRSYGRFKEPVQNLCETKRKDGGGGCTVRGLNGIRSVGPSGEPHAPKHATS